MQPRAEPRTFVSAGSPAAAVGARPGAGAAAPVATASTGTVGLEAATVPGPSWLLAPLPATVLAALAIWFSRGRWLPWFQARGLLPALRRVLGQAERGDDQPEFGAALLDWHEVILQGDPTPRGVKRFVNRVRFLAMMEQSQPESERIPDTLLVALTALHHARLPLDGGHSADAVEAMGKSPYWPPGDEQLARFERLMQQLHIR